MSLPLGTGTLQDFSEDGRRLTLTWSTPGRPSDVFLVDATSGEVAAVREEARPGLAGLPAVEASLATVRSFDGNEIPVNLYLPGPDDAGDRAQGVPVIVTVHGGPAASSAVRWNLFTRFFTALGYAVVEPNIRGSTGFGRAYEMADDGPRRLDAVLDVEAVGRWAAAQPWADGSRLVIHGGSYGGYIVLMGLSHQPDLWRAGIDLFGVVNLRTTLATTTGFIEKIFRREFGDVREDGEFLDLISPITHVSRIRDPLFVYAGANDPRVPRAESDQIVGALRGRGLSVEYMVVADEGHSLDRRENQIELLVRSARFLEAHLD